jgi:hypothetical protein
MNACHRLRKKFQELTVGTKTEDINPVSDWLTDQLQEHVVHREKLFLEYQQEVIKLINSWYEREFSESQFDFDSDGSLCLLNGDLKLDAYEYFPALIKNVEGTIYMETDCRIRSMDHLELVSGGFHANSFLKSLRSLKKVFSVLDLAGSAVKEIPCLEFVGEDLILRGSKELTELPDLKYVGNTLFLENSDFQRAPELKHVGGGINLNNVKLFNFTQAFPELNHVGVGFDGASIIVNDYDLFKNIQNCIEAQKLKAPGGVKYGGSRI